MATSNYYATHFNTFHMQKCADTLALKSHEKTQSHSTQPSRPQPMASQHQSILFVLPAELRNQIYHELLCSNTPSRKALHDYSQERRHAAQPVYPAILSTCQRIHEEAQDLLYSNHIFHAHTSLLTSLPHLVSPLKPIVNAAAIAKISRWHLDLRLDTDPRFTETQATRAFSGAEYLEIHAWQSMFGGCDDSVLALFKGIRGVKVARVTGCAEPEVARWLEEKMMTPLEEQQQGDQDVEMCCCANGVCGKCGEKMGEAEMQWFQRNGSDVWTFGNR